MVPTALPIRQPPRRLDSVTRALELLLQFRERNNGMTVLEAAKILSVTKSTASRLLANLAALGFTIVDPDTRRYVVGPSAFQVGSKFEGANVARAVMPILRRLAESANCTAQIGTLQGSHVLYLGVAQGGGRLRVAAEPGDERYVHSSAMGKALLTTLKPAARSSVLEALLTGDGRLPATGPKTIRDPDVLERELIVTSERGYSISNEDAEVGIAAIGVPIPNLIGPRLAISAAFPAAELMPMMESGTPELLKSVATEIRDRLGADIGIRSDASEVMIPPKAQPLVGHPRRTPA